MMKSDDRDPKPPVMGRPRRQFSTTVPTPKIPSKSKGFYLPLDRIAHVAAYAVFEGVTEGSVVSDLIDTLPSLQEMDAARVQRAKDIVAKSEAKAKAKKR